MKGGKSLKMIFKRKRRPGQREDFFCSKKFTKQQNESRKQYDEEILKKEELMEQQLRSREESFNNQLTDSFL